MNAKAFVISDMIARFFTLLVRENERDIIDTLKVVDEAWIRINVFNVQSTTTWLTICAEKIDARSGFSRHMMKSSTFNLNDVDICRQKVWINDETLGVIDMMFWEAFTERDMKNNIASSVNPHLLEIELSRNYNNNNEISVVFRNGDTLEEITRFNYSIMTHSQLYIEPNYVNDVRIDDNETLSEDDIRPLN